MLEDLYSENLVDEPDDIERVIEGEDLERKEASEHGSGNEEEKNTAEKEKENESTKIKRKQGPRIVLNAQRLTGPRGIKVMESFFSDIPEKMQGKGREKKDLDLVMGRLEHWAHRMMPRFQFDDCLKKIETLGNKKIVINTVKRIRLGMEDEMIREEEIEEESAPSDLINLDPFDKLISSSIPTRPADMEMTSDQREQMLRNRLIAEERRAARIKKAQEMKEKFQTQQIAASQIDCSQPKTLDIMRGKSLEIVREGKEDMKHGKTLLREVDPVSVAVENLSEESDNQNDSARMEIPVDTETLGGTRKENGQTIAPVVIHGPEEDIEHSVGEQRRHEDQVDAMEVLIEVETQDGMRKENEQPIVPVVTYDHEEDIEHSDGEQRKSRDQVDVIQVRSGNQIDTLTGKFEKNSFINLNQQKTLAQGDDIPSDILSAESHERNGVFERIESQQDIVERGQTSP